MEAYYKGLKARMREGLESRPQEWLAERTSFHINQVQRYLAYKDENKDKPPVAFVAAYCMALPLINPAWVLLGGDEDKYRSASDEPLPTSEALQNLVDRLKRKGL